MSYIWVETARGLIHRGRKKLEETESEKDLWVMIHQSLKPSMQYSRVANKGNAVLGKMLQGVGYRDMKVFIDL